jgi:hypothetical protein
MNIHVAIFKHNFSEFANGEYFGNFQRMIELPLTDEQVTKLINFYLAIDDFRSRVVDTLSRADAFSHKFFTSADQSTGISILGVVKLSDLTDVIRTGTEYTNFVNTRDAVWDTMGWTKEEERIVVIETTFNPDTLEFSNIPTTFDELEVLYNSAESLNSFLAKLE